MWEEAAMVCYQYCPRVYLRGLRKIMKTLSMVCPGRDSNRAPSVFKSDGVKVQ
jgi:hypothetical protein